MKQNDSTSSTSRPETSETVVGTERMTDNITQSAKSDDVDDAIEAIDDCELEAEMVKEETSGKAVIPREETPETDVMDRGKSDEDIADVKNEDLLPSTAFTVSTLFCSDEGFSGDDNDKNVHNGNKADETEQTVNKNLNQSDLSGALFEDIEADDALFPLKRKSQLCLTLCL
ncbi:hypothetical protein BSL78_19578 [Apostichopus japonicus]|uniref:Uncharacterized protein n=1 Tax=Stichopus japonicus TaxID=307972 RepID=A0A2G8K6A9_STIJA|nr:hypothetical protein BSL78_19578 [Apostichopus japonicus]